MAEYSNDRNNDDNNTPFFPGMEVGLSAAEQKAKDKAEKALAAAADKLAEQVVKEKAKAEKAEQKAKDKAEQKAKDKAEQKAKDKADKEQKALVKKAKIEPDALTGKSVKKTPKPKADTSRKTLFRALLGGLDMETLKKPWMAAYSFVLKDTDEKLAAWVDQVLADRSLFVAPYAGASPQLVVAVDTETTSLDTRVLVHREQSTASDGSIETRPVYEVKVELAGVCLSVNGIQGIYVPLNHDNASNVTRAGLNYHLQRLFDQAHLVFYHAKYDREILRLTAGIVFRPYPYYEDVQCLNYIVDPKAIIDDDKKYTGSSGGLKALAKEHLDLEQIEIESLVKVLADWCPRTSRSECSCTAEERKLFKHTRRVQYAPFTWVPTELAKWYAGADAIVTWKLWDKFRAEAQSRALVHAIDGELVDSLTWIERQRLLVADEALRRTTAWHADQLLMYRARLRELANEAGWQELADEDGNILEDSRFHVDSKDLAKLLYEVKKFAVVKRTEKGAPSCGKEAMAALVKEHPKDEFLATLRRYKKIFSLHPGHLRYEEHDKSACISFKQSTVAGGRLAASGGNFDKNGGCGINPQAVKKIEDRWLVLGRLLVPDAVTEDEVEPHPEEDLHPSCYQEIDGERRQAPGILHNHIANYLGYAICLVPGCRTCADKFGVLIENGRLDARQTINLRALFGAAPGWTYLSSDWSNIEMRVAANESREPAFVHEFNQGSGDFHSLTASNVFPAFNNPMTSKDDRKKLRSLAKIINFALLYGGTAITVLRNMLAEKPDLTLEEAKEMVEHYWAGVPVYKIYCDKKQKQARQRRTCHTFTGRIIKFNSMMRALHIFEPLPRHLVARQKYWSVRKQFRAAEAAGRVEDAKVFKDKMDELWADPTLGVRNALDHHSFIGKIERISVNAPLQGLAGDLMRMAINFLCHWATVIEPRVQSVLRVHASVHDELDYAVKNEYLPFVVPRITRWMKLRRLQRQAGWPVDIEAETEYGPSWDVIYHLTGDSDHLPAGWTDVEGMGEYLPACYSLELVNHLVAQIGEAESETRQQAWAWAEQTLHPRALEAFRSALYERDKKTKRERPLVDPLRIRKQVIAALQLDEYHRVDATPDDQPMETMIEFEARCGLTEANRGFMPEGGFLGSLPLSGVRRPALTALDPLPPPPPEPAIAAPLLKPLWVEDDDRYLEARSRPVELAPAALAPAALAAPRQPSGRRWGVLEPHLNHAVPAVSAAFPPCPVLRPLNPEEFKALLSHLQQGMGTLSTRVVCMGQHLQLLELKTIEIPDQYLAAPKEKCA